MEPDPTMVAYPRDNPYVFYEEYLEPDDEEVEAEAAK